MVLDKKSQFFSFFRFDQSKAIVEIILSEFAMKKDTFFDLERQNLFSLTHAFGQKMPIFLI